jgi:hypothetical protein
MNIRASFVPFVANRFLMIFVGNPGDIMPGSFPVQPD